jgi:hypothetical protein
MLVSHLIQATAEYRRQFHNPGTIDETIGDLHNKKSAVI